MRAALAFVVAGFAVAASALTPANNVQPWAPTPISSSQFESHPAFDPLNGDLYFVRSSPAFEGWRILRSRCKAGGWSEPVDAAFAGDGVEADPYFSDGGRTLWFISTRTTDGVKRTDLDIWRVERDDKGRWQTPTRLPEPVNSPGQEWFPRPSADGWLYFGSDRAGGLGNTDIWRAREHDGEWTIENLGAAINTAKHEYEPLPSPDGKRLIVMGGDALYESRRGEDGWAPRTKLPPQVNVNGSEIGALFSPSGRSLMFARDLVGGQSGELFVWYERGDEAWPPRCAAKGR